MEKFKICGMSSYSVRRPDTITSSQSGIEQHYLTTKQYIRPVLPYCKVGSASIDVLIKVAEIPLSKPFPSFSFFRSGFVCNQPHTRFLTCTPDTSIPSKR